MFNPDDIHALCFSTEKQIIDRKSARISARDLAIPLVAMANVDGGYIAIGIEDDGEITENIPSWKRGQSLRRCRSIPSSAGQS